jgi:hypothetical protein
MWGLGYKTKFCQSHILENLKDDISVQKALMVAGTLGQDFVFLDSIRDRRQWKRRFKLEMQRVLMKQRILRMGYDSQEIFSVCDL